MEIPHEDQSSHYDHEKDKFAYLSMRDRIELGKRQVQQSQWGSKYVLNEDMSMKAKLASMARRIEEFELRNVHTEAQPQAMPTSFEYINHPNLTTQPQPQPSMSTSSLEQAILKISKVMEDFGKRKLPPQPHHNLQGTNAKRSRKVLKIDTLVGDCYDNSMDQPSIENHKHPLLRGREEKRIPLDQKPRMPILFGIQGEFNMKWVFLKCSCRYDACKNRSYGENKGKQGRKAKTEHTTPFRQLLGTFLSLPKVHFMRTISRLKAWEVRSP
ncbi:hypothetical protein AAG906_027287 [Vitis piasezkii]